MRAAVASWATLCALALPACAQAPSAGDAARPQLGDAQAADFSRAAVLGDWRPDDAEPGTPRFVVDRHGADGRTRFETLQSAILRAHEAARAGAGPVVIGLVPGVYEEVVHLPPGAGPITLKGLGLRAADVRLRFALHAGATGDDFARRVAGPMRAAGDLPESVALRLARCAARDRIGTFCTAVLTVQRDGTRLRHLTVENAHDPGAGQADPQAIALAVEGADRVHLDGVRIVGHQDTLLLAKAEGPSRSFVDRSLVAGDVDFIFGNGTAYFQRSEIRFNGGARGRSTGYIAAPSTDRRTPHGFVFDDCDFTAVPAQPLQRVHLARQWFPGAACSPYGDRAAACSLAREGAPARPDQLAPATLAAVGRMAVLRSRLGPHVAADEPWAPWQRDRAHRAYRPVLPDSDAEWTLLAAAGHDPAAWGLERPRPALQHLAEHRNRLCGDARAPCKPDPRDRPGLE